jgi:hypothetical protein
LSIKKEEEEEDLDDETWIEKKKEFWEKNNISPLVLQDGSISPADLQKRLHPHP